MDPGDYQKALSLLELVPFNVMFARSVVEQRVRGVVFADEEQAPKVFYIVHPYGMSLLLGSNTNTAFNGEWYQRICRGQPQRTQVEWMQVYPDQWEATIAQVAHTSPAMGVSPRHFVEQNTRVNFKLNLDKFKQLQVALAAKSSAAAEEITLIRASKPVFNSMEGSVVPSKFWNSADDFLRYGIGYCLRCNGDLAATAFSSFVSTDQLEIGIETVPKFRGKGYAVLCCAELIHHCIRHHLEPVWSCNEANVGSYKLALKLGFEPTLRLPYYRLGL